MLLTYDQALCKLSWVEGLKSWFYASGSPESIEVQGVTVWQSKDGESYGEFSFNKTVETPIFQTIAYNNGWVHISTFAGLEKITASIYLPTKEKGKAQTVWELRQSNKTFATVAAAKCWITKQQ